MDPESEDLLLLPAVDADQTLAMGFEFNNLSSGSNEKGSILQVRPPLSHVSHLQIAIRGHTHYSLAQLALPWFVPDTDGVLLHDPRGLCRAG